MSGRGSNLRIRAFARLDAFLRGRGYAVVPKGRTDVGISEGLTLLLGLSSSNPLVMVIVGAGTDAGATPDPGLQFALQYPDRVARAILIEPVPERAGRLRELVPPEVDVDVVECAVGITPGGLTLWAPDEWAAGRLAAKTRGHGDGHSWTSADRQHVARNVADLLGISTDEASEHLVQREVAVRPLQDILVEAGIEALHYLQVDTEGFDDVVLESLDLDSTRPSVIRFERIHLDAARRSVLDARLLGAGYSHAYDGHFDSIYTQR